MTEANTTQESTSVYTVVFATKVRKENSIRVHSAYKTFDAAKEFVDSFPTFQDPTDNYSESTVFFEPESEVLLERVCGMIDPGDAFRDQGDYDDFDEQTLARFTAYEQQYKEYESTTWPWQPVPMGWLFPCVFIVKTPLF